MSYWDGGGVGGGAVVGVAVFGLVTFFLTGGFLVLSVSSITVFLGGAGGVAASVLTCALKRFSSSSLLSVSFWTRSPRLRRAFSNQLMSLLKP